MAVNSRAKGCRGEREAVHLLRSLGFTDAVRAAQVSGKFSADVVCPESLAATHLEIKYAYPVNTFSIGSVLWSKACVQAEGDAKGKPWAVLWRNKGAKRWNATAVIGGYIATVSEPAIASLLRELNVRGPESTKV